MILVIVLLVEHYLYSNLQQLDFLKNVQALKECKMVAWLLGDVSSFSISSTTCISGEIDSFWNSCVIFGISFSHFPWELLSGNILFISAKT